MAYSSGAVWDISLDGGVVFCGYEYTLSHMLSSSIWFLFVCFVTSNAWWELADHRDDDGAYYCSLVLATWSASAGYVQNVYCYYVANIKIIECKDSFISYFNMSIIKKFL